MCGWGGVPELGARVRPSKRAAVSPEGEDIGLHQPMQNWWLPEVGPLLGPSSDKMWHQTWYPTCTQDSGMLREKEKELTFPRHLLCVWMMDLLPLGLPRAPHTTWHLSHSYPPPSPLEINTRYSVSPHCKREGGVQRGRVARPLAPNW